MILFLIILFCFWFSYYFYYDLNVLFIKLNNDSRASRSQLASLCNYIYICTRRCTFVHLTPLLIHILTMQF